MAQIKRPSELPPKTTIAALIYGQPGIGKTTLACSAPNPVLFDFDGGVFRVNGAFQVPTVQITQWEDVAQAIDEMGDVFNTIVIDTVGKMLTFMEDYIRRTNPKMRQNDGSLTLKGYTLRNKMFKDFKDLLLMKCINVIFVAHENETKLGEDTYIRPLISGRSANELMQDIDLIGYMEAFGRERTISFDPTEKFYGKNTCNMPSVTKIKNLLDESGAMIGQNDFLTNVLKRFINAQIERKKNVEEFEELVTVIDAKIDFITDAATANEVMTEILSMKHIWNSKALAGRKIADKAKELGLRLNNGRYE